MRLFADHHQLHVLDSNARGDLEAAWTVQAAEDRVAAAGDIVAIGTLSAVDVEVEVILATSPPTRDAEAEHVTEAPLSVRSGALVVAGCTDDRLEAAHFALASGDYVVRSSHRGLSKGVEAIRIEVFPSVGALSAPHVLVRFEAHRSPKKPRAKVLRTWKAAAAAARGGRVDEALDVLRAKADAGDPAPAASVAEILAFRGQWAEVVTYATQLLARPEAVYAGNVMSDMVNLVRRAARELGDPSVVDRALAVLPARDRADARRVFEADQEVPQPERFVQAVREQSASKRFRGKPDALAAHLFAVAVALHVDDEILARWDPTHQGMLFGHAVSVARVHARRGELTRAWSVIEGHVPRWWPVDHAQVAPVELLIDPLLAPLVTPERAEWVLRTPRGGE